MGSIHSVNVDIILPCLNERDSLPSLIRQIVLQLPCLGQIFIADDGSTDGTREYILSLVEDGEPIRLLDPSPNLTLSSAVFAAIPHLKSMVAIVMDADGQHPVALLPELIATLVTFPERVAIASRMMTPDGLASFTRTRKLMTIVGTKTIKRRLSLSTTDPLSGYFAIRLDTLKKIRICETHSFKPLLNILLANRNLNTMDTSYKIQQRELGYSKFKASHILELLMILAPKFTR
jgi:dolichol-phosphate mannosyltransferase